MLQNSEINIAQQNVDRELMQNFSLRCRCCNNYEAIPQPAHAAAGVFTGSIKISSVTYLSFKMCEHFEMIDTIFIKQS